MIDEIEWVFVHICFYDWEYFTHDCKPCANQTQIKPTFMTFKDSYQGWNRFKAMTEMT